MAAMRKLPVVLICRNPTAFPLPPNQRQIRRVLHPQEGRIAIVTNVGCGMRWTCWLRETNAAGRVRQSRVVLTPRRWCQVGGSHSAGDGGKTARSRGEHEISCRAVAQGMSVEGVLPVVTNSSCFFTFAREAMGAARTRHSLRPLLSEGHGSSTARAHARRENDNAHQLFEN